MRIRLAPLGFLLALPAAITACPSSPACNTGRVKSADGVCVREDVADFVACVNNSGSKALASDDVKKINASALNLGAGAEWRNEIRQQYSGPTEQNQAAVVDHCIRMTGGAGSKDDPSVTCRARRTSASCDVDADCCPGERCNDDCQKGRSSTMPGAGNLLAQCVPSKCEALSAPRGS